MCSLHTDAVPYTPYRLRSKNKNWTKKKKKKKEEKQKSNNNTEH